MAITPTNPLDATGRAAEQAAKRNAKVLAERADEISLSRSAEVESLKNDLFDPKQPDAPIFIDEIEEIGVSVNNDKVIIRTVADIEDMTYGVGNQYTFKAGVKYSVPRHLADYLERLGYIWQAGS
jgi:ferritin-like protein